MNKYFRFLFFVLSIVSLNQNSYAIDVSFTGEFSDSWHDDDNWDDAFAPSLGEEEYFIQNELTATYATGESTIKKLVVGDSSPGTFLMTGGDLTISGGGDSFQVGRGCCEADGLVELSGTAILRTTLNSGVGERDNGVLHIGPDASVLSPDAYWRVGNFGPSVDAGLEGNGLIDVEGTFDTRSLFIGVQDGTGVLRVRGTGAVTLSPFADGDPSSADINMNFNHDPNDHPNQSGTIHMMGSEASLSARTLQSQHDAASPIKNLLWFTADEGGVSPITLSEEVNIDNNKLMVELNDLAFGNLETLLLVDAAPGQILGSFAELEVTGGSLDASSYSVIYDQDEGDILLQFMQSCADGFGCQRSDITQNGVVDFADFLLLSVNFGNAASAEERSDINQNGIVDFADFLVLSSDFGRTVSPPAVAVPEPSQSCVSLLLICGLASLRSRRR